MASLELPFEQGTTLDSGSYGSVPTKYLGSRYTLRDGTELQIVKNTDAAALSGCKLVDWESLASGAVTEASGASSEILAGVVDPAYAVAGTTVPANSLFYIVKRGRSHVISGASITVNQGLVSHGTDGTCQDVSDISGAAAAVFGVAVAATASGASTECIVLFR